MKILVTGAKGFVGRNLCAELKNMGFADVYEFDKDTDQHLLEDYTRKCDFVYHLAGVNRPKEEKEFMEGNCHLTSNLLDLLKRNNNKSPVLFSSSVQAEWDNPYGRSKKAAEDLLFNYGKNTGVQVYVYRLPNLFGKWGRPSYNSVIATFCHNIARDLPITVNNSDTVLSFAYIDDVVEEFIKALSGRGNQAGELYQVPEVYTVALNRIVSLLTSFKDSREKLSVPNMSDHFTRKLYSTYLSYMPEDQLSYQLKINGDDRGSFTEFIKTPDRGQVSVNVTKPGITKGNHWHHSKNEKFLVVSGQGVIRLRNIQSDAVTEFFVSGDRMQVVEIPPGYAHNIENLGSTDLVTVMWANECFNPERPDTYYSEV